MSVASIYNEAIKLPLVEQEHFFNMFHAQYERERNLNEIKNSLIRSEQDIAAGKTFTTKQIRAELKL